MTTLAEYTSMARQTYFKFESLIINGLIPPFFLSHIAWRLPQEDWIDLLSQLQPLFGTDAALTRREADGRLYLWLRTENEEFSFLEFPSPHNESFETGPYAFVAAHRFGQSQKLPPAIKLQDRFPETILRFQHPDAYNLSGLPRL